MCSHLMKGRPLASGEQHEAAAAEAGAIAEALVAQVVAVDIEGEG